MTINKCVGCLAPEGQVHRWGCDNEECPFCGGQLISCNCFNDMMDLILERADADTVDHFSFSEKQRWVNLIGDLKDLWQQVLSSPHDICDMLENTPQDWCTTQEQLQTFSDISKICIKTDVDLNYIWEEFCAEKGRIPYLGIPNICACCGKNWPEMFDVPDREWEKYVITEYQDKELCLDCYQKQKILFPDGWKRELSRIQKQQRNKVTMTRFKQKIGYQPICLLCGGHNGIASNISKTLSAKYLVPALNKGAICSACFDRMRKLFPDGWKNAGALVKIAEMKI